MEKIWEEEIPNIPTSPPAHPTETPVGPPKKRGLWGMINERASSWTEGEEKKKQRLEKEEMEKELDRKLKEKEKELSEKKVLPPPPTHPSVAFQDLPSLAAPKPLLPPPPPPRRSEARRLPPPFVAKPDDITHSPVDDTPPKPDDTPPHASHIPLPESRPESPAAPPPLPRRAASRRPLSMALTGSRPGTPLVKEEPVVAKDEPVDAKDEPVVAKEETVEPDPVEPVKDDPVVVESKAEVNGNATEELAKEEDFPVVQDKDLNVTDSDSDADSIVVEMEKPKPDSEPTGFEDRPLPPPLPRRARPVPPPPPVEGVAPLQGSTDTEGEAGNDERDGFRTPPEFVNGSDSPINEDELEDETDRGMYIGDATWEERTWKDLVKIKEDLFWARVGGLR